MLQQEFESEVIIPVLLQRWVNAQTSIKLGGFTASRISETWICFTIRIVVGWASDSNALKKQKNNNKWSFSLPQLRHRDWWLPAFDASDDWSWKSCARFLCSHQSAMLAAWLEAVVFKRQPRPVPIKEIRQLTVACDSLQLVWLTLSDCTWCHYI